MKFNKLIDAMHRMMTDGGDVFEDYLNFDLSTEDEKLEDSIFKKVENLIPDFHEVNDFEGDIASLEFGYEKVGFRNGFIFGVRLMTEVFCNE